ncbi:MAG: hypothetical protein H7Y04_11315, partial [Verrucomicrobia bacterium]|nr:hypothetical protein [Cytophagales bacterium]
MTAKMLEGKLLLYSETGMEGGYLSIQDKKFITFNAPKFAITNNCEVVDKNNTSRFGVTSNAEVLIDNHWLEIPDPILKEADYQMSSLFCGELNGDLEADKRLAQKYNFNIKYSAQRLDEMYGPGNWKVDSKLPNVILKDGTLLHFGDMPTTIPSRPYQIPLGAKTSVTVDWKDGSIQ